MEERGIAVGFVERRTLKVQYLLSSKQVALRQQQMKLLVQQQKQRSKLQLKRAPDERRDVDGHADGFYGRSQRWKGGDRQNSSRQELHRGLR